MYIADFFSKVLRKANFGVLIYLVINIIIIIALIELLFANTAMENWGLSSTGAYLACAVIGLVIYLISIMIALSPVGEYILRLQTGCREIKRQDHKDFFDPLFDEVYRKAKMEDPNLPNDIQLFINDDENPGAFATGRKTVCLTEGLMKQPAEQIKAAFAHEFGHLSHKDTDLLLVITVGNFIVTAIVLFIRIFMWIFRGIMVIGGLFRGGEEGCLIALSTWMIHFIFIIVISGLMKAWTALGVLLCMKSSREKEYEADEFAARLGYSQPLCELLDEIDGNPPEGLFATLASTHPHRDDRIARLQNYCNYTGFTPVRPGAGGGTAGPGAGGGTPAVRPAPTAQVKICSYCGAQMRPNAQFCIKCGKRVSKNAPAGSGAGGGAVRPGSRGGAVVRPGAGGGTPAVTPAPAAQAIKCSYCGAQMRPNVQFCTKCGQRVSKNGSAGSGAGGGAVVRPGAGGGAAVRPGAGGGTPAVRPAPKAQANKCSYCGVQMRPNAQFCTKCGQRVSKNGSAGSGAGGGGTARPGSRGGAVVRPGAGGETPAVRPAPKAQANKCSYCGAQMRPNAQFCTKCGKRVNSRVPER